MNLDEFCPPLLRIVYFWFKKRIFLETDDLIFINNLLLSDYRCIEGRTSEWNIWLLVDTHLSLKHLLTASTDYSETFHMILLFSRFWLADFFSINQNREHNISFEDFLCYLKDPRVSNLHILDLTFNRIGNILKLGSNCQLIGFSVSISMADFGTHLSKLQMLKLSKNEITTVVDEAFSKLTRLSQLDLSYNRLRVSLTTNLVSTLDTMNLSLNGRMSGLIRSLKCPPDPVSNFIFIAFEWTDVWWSGQPQTPLLESESNWNLGSLYFPRTEKSCDLVIGRQQN